MPIDRQDLRRRLAALALLGLSLGCSAKPVKRAGCLGDGVGRYRAIAGCGIDAAVAKQHLDEADSGAAFQYMRGDAVAFMPSSA